MVNRHMHRVSTRRPRRAIADRRPSAPSARMPGGGRTVRRMQADSQRGFGANAGLAGMAAGQLGDHRRFVELIEGFRGAPTLYRERELYSGVAAVLAGRFADAEQVALDVFTTSPYDATVLVAGAQLLWINRELGKQGEMLDYLRQAVSDNPGIVALRAGLAFIEADLGLTEEARATIDALISDDFEGIPEDTGWPSTLCSLADAVATIGYRDAAGTLAEKIEPFSGLLVCYPSFVAFIGAADRYRAMMLTLLGRFDEAEPLFTTAIELEEKMQSPPLVARSKLWYARMLIARGAPADEQRARDLISEMREVADALGMQGLLRQADALVTGSV
jgi:tetratricopeptide (TPR) repeat protein